MKKCAFVASGGGLKGYAFHIGVLRALEEMGFVRTLSDGRRAGSVEDSDYPINVYVGSSAGACAVAAALGFETLDDAEGVVGLQPTRLPRFRRSTLFGLGLRHLRRRPGGVFYANRVEQYFRRLLPSNDFREIVPETYLCATQLNSSRKVVFGPHDSAVGGTYDKFIAYYNDVAVSDAIAASVSYPGIFRPYMIRSKRSGEIFDYSDGEVRETLSVHIARDIDVDLAVISNVWMPYHFDSRYGSVSRMGLGHILKHTFTQVIEQKIDRFRNEYDRHRAAIDVVRRHGKEYGLSAEQIEDLVERISAALKYRAMDQIWIAPRRTDSDFNLARSWSFQPDLLRYARDFGYRRAREALERWRDGRDDAYAA